MGRSLGIDAGDVARLVGATLPVLIEQLGSNAKSGDANALTAAVAKDHDGGLLDDAAGFLGGRFSGGPGMSIKPGRPGNGIDRTHLVELDARLDDDPDHPGYRLTRTDADTVADSGVLLRHVGNDAAPVLDALRNFSQALQRSGITPVTPQR